jgi:hypothetical protein
MHRDVMLTLEKNGNSWKVNGSDGARTDLIEVLLKAMQRIEIVSPASKMVRAQLTEKMAKHGRLVKLYRNNRLARSFYVYFDSLGIKGTYMMKPGSDAPYMIKLKGYSEQNIENLFPTSESIWREHVIFGFEPGHIAEITVQYPAEPGKSFRINRTDNNVLVLSDMVRPLPKDRINQQEVSDYLAFFGKIPFQPVANSAIAFADQEKPFIQIVVRDVKGNETTLKAFRIPVSPGDNRDYDKNRFVALINHDHDTVVINYADADPVMRQLGNFQKK